MNKAKKSLSVILSFVMLICAFVPLCAYASADAIKPLKKSVKLHCVAWGDPQVSHYLTEREPYLISSANDVKNNKKAPIDALILAGDITENCIQDEWDWVYDDIKDMGVKNYINATGNHDIRVHDYDDAIYIFTTFTNRLNRNAGSKLRIKKAYYSYKVNGYKFIVLGSEAATLEEAEISKKQLIHAWDHVRNIAINVRLNVRTIENIPVPVSSASVPRHSTVPDPLVHFHGIAAGKMSFPFIQLCEIQ